MGAHESKGKSDEWYTPAYIFEALGMTFDMDVAAAPEGLGFVPAKIMCRDAFNTQWEGFVWCNPPWSGKGKKQPWIDKINEHGNGILLAPDRSSAPWWQDVAQKADLLLMVNGKIKFIPGPGNESNGEQPGNGTTLFAFGPLAVSALINAQKNGLGISLYRKNQSMPQRIIVKSNT